MKQLDVTLTVVIIIQVAIAIWMLRENDRLADKINVLEIWVQETEMANGK